MVVHRPRIETEEAKVLRSKRQHFAAPGGTHDRVVRFLSRALPMAVGALAALMIITPLGPRGEVSFLLDRDEVATIKDRFRIDDAMYRGTDNRGRPFSLTAAEAVQKSGAEGIVRLRDLAARILLPDGPAMVEADAAAFEVRNDRLDIIGPMRMEAADGYRMLIRDVSIDLDSKKVVGADGVSGIIPSAVFSANRLEADVGERTLALAGNARMRMIPGRLRMPQ